MWRWFLKLLVAMPLKIENELCYGEFGIYGRVKMKGAKTPKSREKWHFWGRLRAAVAARAGAGDWVK